MKTHGGEKLISVKRDPDCLDMIMWVVGLSHSELLEMKNSIVQGLKVDKCHHL